MKTFEYRLFVTKQQHALLVQCLRESRLLYNEMLAITKAQYEEKGTFPSKYDLTRIFAGRGGEHVPATTVQMLADRLTKSLKRFLACKELALKVGFPASRKAINGTLFSFDSTAKMSMCTRIRNTSSCRRSWDISSRSSCIARSRARPRLSILSCVLMGIGMR